MADTRGVQVSIPEWSAASSRWPLLAGTGAIAFGGRHGSLLVLELGQAVGSRSLGSLTVSRDFAPPFTPAEAEALTEFSRLLAVMVLERWRATLDVDRLEGVLPDQRHLAAGMLASGLGVDVNQSLAIIRARAFAEGRTLADVSADIVEVHEQRHPGASRYGTPPHGPSS